MTGLPPPDLSKHPKAKEVQDEVVTAEEVEAEAFDSITPEIIRRVKNLAVACLWRGTDLPGFSNDVYGVNYVDALMRGVQRHVPNGRLHLIVDDHYFTRCFGNQKILSVEQSRFEGHGIGGWSNMFECFRENLRPNGTNRVVGMNLDIVLVGDCEWLWHWDRSPVGLPMDPFKTHVPANPVWTFDREGAEIVWDAYMEEKKTDMKNHREFGVASEMSLLRTLWNEHKWAPLEARPQKLLSYKAHVKRGMFPDKLGSSVVYCHGNEKPHQLPLNNRLRMEWDKP